MSYKKLVNDFNSIIDSIINDHLQYEKAKKAFFTQLKEEENNVRKKLKKINSKASRKKLKKKLGMVQQAYAYLETV